MNLFLLLTAMLSALTGVGRAVDAQSRAGVEASRVVALAEVAASATPRAAIERPDGYVAPAPLMLDLRLALAAVRPVVPERRRV